MRRNPLNLGPKWTPLLIWGTVGLWWVTLWNVLRIDWDTNAQYAFGWSTPLIAICFFFLRWNRRPDPKQLRPREWAWICVALAGFVIVHLPLRFVEEANAEWRMLFWIRWAQCAALSFGFLGLVGGRPWMRHFAFPIFFTAVAVPWPVFAETALIQTLTRGVAAITVEGLFWQHIPAVRLGNLVQLAGDTVGLSEACSGLRSLQTSLMLALVAGEFWNLSRTRRVVLVTLGVVAAFLLNSARTLTLSMLVESRGRASFDHWHDLAGNVEMGCCILVIFLFGHFLGRRVAPKSGLEPSPRVGEWRSIPIWLPALILGTWAVAEAGTQWWFARHTVTRFEAAQWKVVVPPVGNGDFVGLVSVQIPENTRTQLRTNDGVSYSWRQPGGMAWNLTFVKWPDGRSSIAGVTVHHPDVCLAAAGHHFDGEGGPVTYSAKGVPITFRHYLFDSQTRPLHAFFSLLDLDTPLSGGFQCDLTWQGRIGAAVAGRRNTRQGILEVLVSGAPASEAAAQALPKVLDTMLSRERQ